MNKEVEECPNGGNHKWGTDGMHSNQFCKKCFTNYLPMKSEVQKLVEWVVDKLWEGICSECYIPDSINNCTRTKVLAKQILSHPKLALIANCELCEGNGYLPNDDTGELNHPVGGIRCPICHETGIIPVPLAEALKQG